MDFKNNFDLVMKELKEIKYVYIDEEHLLFDAMIYELKASTYFIYETIKYKYTICNN